MPASCSSSDFLSLHHPLLSFLRSSRNSSVSAFKRAHALLVVSGLAYHPFAASELISHLLSFSPPHIPYADLIFHHTPRHTLFTYNTLIRAHSSHPSSFLLFDSMLHACNPPVRPNQYTFAFVLGSGTGAGEVEQLHGQLVPRGFDTNVYVSNVLIRVYGDLGRMQDARKVFDGSRVKDLYSWNSLLRGYVGRGDVGSAREVFDRMPERDVVSWSTAIAGFVQEGCFVEALELFRGMQMCGIAANEFTLTSLLAACANLVALNQGKWIHAYIGKSRIQMNERLLAGLVDMYAKCGEVDVASRVFEEGWPKQTTRPWNALLGGYAIHGRSSEAIGLFERMEAEGIAPDKVTFLSLLHACSHGRLVDQGSFYLELMKSYGMEPEIEHYGCMVDVLGRAGRLEEAEQVVRAMPIASDAVAWGTLLAACKVHRDMERVERIGKVVEGLDANHIGCRVLLANVYSTSGRWGEAKDVRRKMEDAGRKKTPGCSSIELDGMFHQFLVGDRSHPRSTEIYRFLDEMAVRLKAAGYVPETTEALVDVDEEDREAALWRHSEKLAIAFGLMNTGPGAAICIVKNLRVCRDCHQATKFISLVYRREIVVRDRIRFHRFKDGMCSCKDYW